MSTITASPRFLRTVLLADAASCLGCGALQLAFPSALPPLLGLPAALLGGTGVFLLAYAAAVALVATRNPVPRPWVWLFAVGNVGWALLCIALLLGAGGVQATPLGRAYVLLQAATVLVMAALQWVGLRQRAPSRLSMVS